MKILIIGASGLVGSRFVELHNKVESHKNKEELLTPSTTELDITSSEGTKDYFNTNNPDVIVNFAAYTNVDGAEKERGDENGLAWKINVRGVENLIEVCKEKIFLWFKYQQTLFLKELKATLVHILKIQCCQKVKMG